MGMSESELLSLVLVLRPEAAPGRALPAWWGAAAHALLLSAVRQVNPELAARLHDEQGPRPFTVSTLMGAGAHRALDPSRLYTLRFTALQAEVTLALREASAAGGPLAPGARLELDYLPFVVEQVFFTSDGHPWAGEGSYRQLMSAHLVQPAPPRRLRLRLASPTGFRSAEKQQPFPLPELVFGSLLERWNSFSPMAFPAEVRRFAAECLGVSAFNLSTRSARLKDSGLRIGCVGEVTFTALHYDRYWMNVLHTLAAYAFFSGVGASTPLGFGQASPGPVLPVEEAPE
ncbi:MAG TPA: CRISPR-associated protein Cas6 [Anaerolinea thermolimosa]|uniref:CRISPR-associated protein Cas6 n=2 Tax=Anaerolinea thermolimosa TaxID=229919 RepID=A0A3D1JJ53_9CHLR|nr:CRISPR-associated protein Cas6 [Anaerolinea thermolimosa]